MSSVRVSSNMLRLTFTSDDDYRRFQFLWIALHNTVLTVTPQRAVSMLKLVSKLDAISRPDGNGRVLRQECEIEITTDEQVLALDAIWNTDWRPEVRHHARDLCRFLGAEFKEDEEEKERQERSRRQLAIEF